MLDAWLAWEVFYLTPERDDLTHPTGLDVNSPPEKSESLKLTII